MNQLMSAGRASVGTELGRQVPFNLRETVDHNALRLEFSESDEHSLDRAVL